MQLPAAESSLESVALASSIERSGSLACACLPFVPRKVSHIIAFDSRTVHSSNVDPLSSLARLVQGGVAKGASTSDFEVRTEGENSNIVAVVVATVCL
jgi:hypothetical protein